VERFWLVMDAVSMGQILREVVDIPSWQGHEW
jgi:hypothetical protein